MADRESVIVRLGVFTHRRLKRLAVLSERTMSEMVQELLDSYEPKAASVVGSIGDAKWAEFLLTRGETSEPATKAKVPQEQTESNSKPDLFIPDQAPALKCVFKPMTPEAEAEMNRILDDAPPAKPYGPPRRGAEDRALTHSMGPACRRCGTPWGEFHNAKCFANLAARKVQGEEGSATIL